MDGRWVVSANDLLALADGGGEVGRWRDADDVRPDWQDEERRLPRPSVASWT